MAEFGEIALTDAPVLCVAVTRQLSSHDEDETCPQVRF